MISGILHKGSGIGNQLFRYVMTRVVALDKGYDFGMVAPELSKMDFMKLDMGKPMEAQYLIGPGGETMITTEHKKFNEKKVIVDGLDIRSYDPEINFVEDGTIIDGEFQDPRYFEHRMDEITDWLGTEPLDIPDDVCVIGFRGGEYTVFPDLFLPESWWAEAIKLKQAINPNMRFEVHTDDPVAAREMFPDCPIIHDAGINWRSIRYAKHAIIANSSFYILPRLLAHHTMEAETIAPRYWGRHNTKTWAMPSNYYKQFTYL